MAIYKFYNIQLLPIDTKKVSEVGVDGYCRLFEALSNQVNACKENGDKLSSIAFPMRGEMFFAPYSITITTYPSKDGESRLVYGSFLKFDDVNEVVDTNSGELLYKSKGNSSSKRYDLEFVFDPEQHVMAIHHTAGLPTRNPLIEALKSILEGHAAELFKNHSLEIEELTAAESIKIFFEKNLLGIKSYDGYVTFSNSGSFDEFAESAIVKKAEKELKDKNVGKWSSKYSSFKGSLMSELPEQAKVQMVLAARYGNVEVSYTDENGEKHKYVMEDHPVREFYKEEKQLGRRSRAIEIKNLIVQAIKRTVSKY
ncbi:TPA: DUF4747 family protein [Providencia stuartii]